MNKMLFATLLGVTALVAAAPAQAQQSQIKQNAIQRTTFYQAPRRIQILDERPLISDFREAPSATPSIPLPPPPVGFGGAGGGTGGGALPNGYNQATPVAQLPAGAGMLPYRTPFDPMGPLPKSGFGRDSNIPARGMGPRCALPGGTTTGVHAIMAAQAPRANNGFQQPRAIASLPRAAAPLATYNSPAYTQAASSAGTSVIGTMVHTGVQGRLIDRLK